MVAPAPPVQHDIRRGRRLGFRSGKVRAIGHGTAEEDDAEDGHGDDEPEHEEDDVHEHGEGLAEGLDHDSATLELVEGSERLEGADETERREPGADRARDDIDDTRHHDSEVEDVPVRSQVVVLADKEALAMILITASAAKTKRNMISNVLVTAVGRIGSTPASSCASGIVRPMLTPLRMTHAKTIPSKVGWVRRPSHARRRALPGGTP